MTKFDLNGALINVNVLEIRKQNDLVWVKNKLGVKREIEEMGIILKLGNKKR